MSNLFVVGGLIALVWCGAGTYWFVNYYFKNSKYWYKRVLATFLGSPVIWLAFTAYVGTALLEKIVESKYIEKFTKWLND